jgi:hypothetical protein
MPIQSFFPKTLIVMLFITHTKYVTSESIFGNKFCEKYNLNKISLPVIEPPPINEGSTISMIFAKLKKIKATKNEVGNTIYYRWDCTSFSLTGKTCIWILPHAYLVGVSKCGTTAFCSKISYHPDIQLYNHKEINIFSKHRYSYKEYWDKFELKIYNKYFTNDLFQKIWIDCSGGTYRDFNAITILQKYSPHTKILYIVRDPWQKLGSLITKFHRINKSDTNIPRIKREMAYAAKYKSNKIRFQNKTILEMLDIGFIGDILMAERLLPWLYVYSPVISNLHNIKGNVAKHESGNTISPNMYIFDNYHLEFHPSQLLYEIENFLGLKHYTFTDDILNSISVNTMQQVQNSVDSQNYKFIQSKNNISNTSYNNSSVAHRSVSRIHEPYSIEDKEFLQNSRDVFAPSLCLFERLLGWSIKIMTVSEIQHFHLEG